ncbi:uncharacterized protein BXZ73DRAFT_61728 [Epithele typhae]|uniref:uncharacterized protein n=1 Tax=Epithele typhae TaxID=378194 RepID=UPI0020072811|nr:uncharacterized protein BXZ73DRAFT_61728 [Epithele typhae]KAH9905086.1 hypothetical protein BXZ73DRAFT_61728 [Epithele typhae]
MADYPNEAYRSPGRTSLYPDAPQYPRQSAAGLPSIRRTPRYSRNSTAPSWVSQGVLSPGPHSYGGPPSSAGSRPLPVPSSSPPSRGFSDFQPVHPPPSELGPEAGPNSGHNSYPGPPSEPGPREEREWDAEENMTIGQSDYEYVDTGNAQSQVIPEDPYAGPAVTPLYPMDEEEETEKPKSRTRKFVGGFVAGLKRLPEAMVRSNFYDRSATRKGAPGMEQVTGVSHFLPPAYHESDPARPGPSAGRYIPAILTPGAPKSPTQVSYADPQRQSSHASRRTSQPSRRTSIPISYLSNGRRSSRAQTIQSESIAASPRFFSADMPVPAELQPSNDYAKMPSAIRFAPPRDDSFSAHVTRVQHFVRALQDLPWTSDRVALDYIPARSKRAHTGKNKPALSWYTGTNGRLQDVDLLAPAAGSTSHARAMQRAGTVTGTVTPSRSPLGSYMTSPGMVSSPGASSHGQGQHMMSYSYYFSPPQPLYVYPSPMASPQPHQPLPRGDGTGSDTSSSSSAAAAVGVGAMGPPQAVPVYMMMGPPPGLLPAVPPGAHGGHRARSPRPSPIPVIPSRATSPRRTPSQHRSRDGSVRSG